ncbi:TRAP transporter large permease [Lacicoccus alkaliphilus]|uniref:C4-dicarboxylate transporter, DctM subunit n=1 Tax=Lacicoccus alkaliphilus DSM 16010 TaxID=1123231 RepID=A0A1M7JV03_9BACL|nr:TRAP transporter large permease [Salinicoccus alkaliphilus]SHM56731.1 C4-dicarboxylate transporter, DctM subunit [Salinicoccus alkaliphilus DSM 16010]
MTVALLFISFFLLMIIGVPIALSLGIASLLTMVFATDNSPTIIIQQAFTSLDSFPLMAIPLFILAGVLMSTGGISERLLNLANVLIGFVAGGLAMVTVLASMFFAAISGSGPATVAAIGSFMIPSMKENNYGSGFAAAITASAGSIGVLIPPSIPFVMYGVVGTVSIGSMFLAGIIPGLILGLALMVISYINAKKNGIEGTGVMPTFKDVLKALNEAKFALLVPVIILGGIYAGLFSPTESAAVASVYALFIGVFIYKELTWKSVYQSFSSAALTNAATVIIIGFSVSFAYLMTRERIPTIVADFIVSLSENPLVIMLIINIFLLIVGMFIDTISAIVILTPILLPVVTNIGLDPIHFGVILVMNLAIGFVTPPLGVNLFVASNVGKVAFEKIAKGMIPILIVMLIALMIVTYFPPLSTWIPSLRD